MTTTACHHPARRRQPVPVMATGPAPSRQPRRRGARLRSRRLRTSRSSQWLQATRTLTRSPMQTSVRHMRCEGHILSVRANIGIAPQPNTC